MALLCGRYEGFDERVHEHFADDEVSIGRYVLAGGELPAMVVADVIMRKLPGALGHADSAVEESFSQALEGMPEYPHFTRPPSYRGWEVPEVLLSGDHEKVRQWRLEQSRLRAEQYEGEGRGAARRPLSPWLPFRDRAVPAPGPAVFSREAVHELRNRQHRARPAEEGPPNFDPGDRVRVHFQVVEGNRKRTQVFEGVVLRRQGSGVRETFTVRKQSFGVGVERTFPLHSPKIEKLEVAARGDVRRAKLYYLRGRIGKAARVAERRWGIDEDMVAAPAAAGESTAVDAEGVSQEEVVPEAAPRRGRGAGRGGARGAEAEEAQRPSARPGGD